MEKLSQKLSYYWLIMPGALSALPRFGPGGEQAPIESVGQVRPLLATILNWFGIILGIISVLVILYTALLYMTAGGSEDRRKKAHSWLIWGIVGIIVALFATVIVPLIISALSGQF